VTVYRLLAMTFGRPFMVDTSFNTPTPLLIDDDYLCKEREGLQPSDMPSRMGLFVFSCKLFEILADILRSLYSGDLRGNIDNSAFAPEMILDVLNFNRRLDSFMCSLPTHLQTTSNTQVIIHEKNSHINLQQQVLYCR